MIDLVTEVVPPLGLARYRALFHVPHVRRLVLSGLLARLPMGMVGLALLLLVRENGGSYAAAGAVSGAYFVATAVGAPIAGRLVDRRGQTRILLPRAVIFPALLSGVCALALLDAPLAAIAVCAAAAGALMPPVGASLRALWPRMFADAELRAAAYALEASLQEITFIVGPLLVALLTAAVSPVLALGVAAVVGGIGTTLIALARAGARVASGGEACRVDPGRARVARRRDHRRPLRLSRPRVRRRPRSGSPPSPRITAAPSSEAFPWRCSRPAASSAGSSPARG